MARIDMQRARTYIMDCGIYRDDQGNYPDFHALDRSTVDALLEIAKEHGYREPRNANGSKGRCFYEYLARTAK